MLEASGELPHIIVNRQIVTFTYGPGRIDEVSYNIDLDLSYSDETLEMPSLLGRDVLDNWHIEYSRKRNLLRCAI